MSRRLQRYCSFTLCLGILTLVLFGCDVFGGGINVTLELVNIGSLSSDEQYNIGECPVGDDLEITVRITNAGWKALTIQSVTLSNNDDGGFTLSSSFTGELGSQENKDYSIIFAPSSSATYTALFSLTLENEDAFTFTLQGTGTGTPQIEVRDVSNTILENGGGGLYLSLGTWSQGSTADSCTLMVKNIGTAPLTISETGSDPSSYIHLGLSDSTLAPDANTSLTVRADTTMATGTIYANIIIASDDPDDPSFTIPCWWIITD